MSEEKLHRIEAVSERLGVKPACVRSWIFKEQIPVIRVGRCVRVADSVLQDILKNGLKLEGEGVSAGAL